MAIRAKQAPCAVSARKNGRQGGLATALKHGSAFCEARAVKGGKAILDRYGRDYYAYMVNLRTKPKGWAKGKSRKST